MEEIQNKTTNLFAGLVLPKMAPMFNDMNKNPIPEAKANLEVEARIRLQTLGIAPTLAGAGGF